MKPFLFLFFSLISILVQAQENLVNEQLIHFDTNNATLSSEEKSKLQALKASLSSSGELMYKIYGHCDSIGSRSANQRLSERRAVAVKDALVKSGISARNIKYEGLSFDKPVSNNGTEEGRKMNRRVELKVFKINNTVSKISGLVKSSKLGNLAATKINFKGKSNDLSVITNKEGLYAITLPSNENYTITANYPNHFGFNKAITTTGDLTIDITLEPLEENQKIKLSDLNFLSNKAVVSPKSIPTLDFISNQLKKDTKVCFEIQGHVNAPFNADPNDAYILDLSLARAVAVYDYLSAHGISKERMTPKGFGFSQMVKPNATSVDDILANMRVEIKILNCEEIKKYILAEDVNNINRVRLSTLYK